MWEIHYLRHVPWTEVSRRETEIVRQVQAAPETGAFLVSEPHPTFTHGLSAKSGDLLWSPAELSRRGITVQAAPRGGQWTYHGPGQIVIFPIFHLETLGLRRRDVRRFIDLTRSALVAQLRRWGISVDPEQDALPYGLYVQGKKLASFGFSFERGVARHGVALYYSPQHIPIAGIHPCGQPAATTTSLQELGVPETWESASEALLSQLKSGFQALAV